MRETTNFQQLNDLPETPRWLHYLAILTMLAALPLLALGAEVTTKGVGMVDPVGFREPWHLAKVWQEGTLAERGLGYLIEHSHRVAGFVVGICAIALAVGLWFGQSRRSLKWLGLVALLAVSVQGVLGIFRVNLHALMGRPLAIIHGCSAHLVFGLLVSLAVVTSSCWTKQLCVDQTARPARLRILALVTLFIVYGQLVLGAMVRQVGTPLAMRSHVLFAFVATAAIAWLIRELFSTRKLTRAETVTGIVLPLLLALQLFLGVESWLGKYLVLDPTTGQAFGAVGLHPHLIRSLHYVIGAFVFAGTLTVTLFMFRQNDSERRAADVAPELERQLEEVA